MDSEENFFFRSLLFTIMKTRQKSTARSSENRAHILRAAGKILLACVWITLIILVFIHRKEITVESITSISPARLIPAMLMLLFLFALKSVTMVVYSGIFYVASGLVLPLWAALLTSFLGTAIMVTIPYILGRTLDDGGPDRLLAKYPKLQAIRTFREQNDFLLPFLAHATSLLPSDPFSLYMGAVKARYLPFLAGSMLGFLPSAAALTVMGDTAGDFTSPTFWAAMAVKIVMVLVSIPVVRRHRQHCGSVGTARHNPTAPAPQN